MSARDRTPASDTGASEYIAAWSQQARQTGTMPKTATFACEYWLNVWMDSIVETLHFARVGDHDELWACVEPSWRSWCAVRRRSEGDEHEACVELFRLLTLARRGHGFPVEVERPGLVTAADLAAIREGILAEERAAVAAAVEQWGDAPLIRAASELGLNPAPAGHKPSSWSARCPETNHALMLQAESGQWGCGYCGKRGGERELRVFVLGRRKRARRGKA